MIADFVSAGAAMVVYPDDEDGCMTEVAIIVSLDADGMVCLTQRNNGICVPKETVGELIRALGKVIR